MLNLIKVFYLLIIPIFVTPFSLEMLNTKPTIKPVEHEIHVTTKIELNSPFSKIDGVFSQIGSNPKKKYHGNKPYNWFDSDGMIHAVFFNKTHVTYVNRWVRTKRYITEEKWKQKLYLNFGDLKGFHGIIHIIKWMILNHFSIIPSNSCGTANTAFLSWNKVIYALNECDLPYKINYNMTSHNITTSNKIDIEGLNSVSAHPKIDINRNKLYLYGYNTKDFKKGEFYHNILDENMNLTSNTNFSMLNNGMVHDIAQTKNKLIVPDLPLKYDFSNIIHNKLPLQFDRNGTSRLGVIDKDIPDKIDWYYLEKSIYIFHFSDSYEEKEKIIVFACIMKDVNMDNLLSPNEELTENGKLRLQKIIINTRTKKVTIHKNNYIEKIDTLTKKNIKYNLDFPISSKVYKNHIYCSIFDINTGRICGITCINTMNFESNKPYVYILKNKYITSEPQCIVIDNKEYLICFTNDDKLTSITLIDVLNKKHYSLSLNNDTIVAPGLHSIFQYSNY